jgi:hypothetical protein
MRGISLVAKGLLASQEGLCSMELVMDARVDRTFDFCLSVDISAEKLDPKPGRRCGYFLFMCALNLAHFGLVVESENYHKC